MLLTSGGSVGPNNEKRYSGTTSAKQRLANVRLSRGLNLPGIKYGLSSGDPVSDFAGYLRDDVKYGLSGVYNAITQDYNPEGKKYSIGHVPTIRGGMVSGGQPDVLDSITSLGPAMYYGLRGRDQTSVEKEAYSKAKGNPRAAQMILNNMLKNKALETTNSIEQKALEDKQVGTMLESILSLHGIKPEDTYRWASGAQTNTLPNDTPNVTFSPNATAALSGVANVADSMRLLDFVGWGAGKPIAAGARIAGHAVKSATEDAVRGTLRHVLNREGAALSPSMGVSRAPVSLPPNPIGGARGRLANEGVYNDNYLVKAYNDMRRKGSSAEEALKILQMGTEFSRQPRTLQELSMIVGGY